MRCRHGATRWLVGTARRFEVGRSTGARSQGCQNDWASAIGQARFERHEQHERFFAAEPVRQPGGALRNSARSSRGKRRRRRASSLSILANTAARSGSGQSASNVCAVFRSFRSPSAVWARVSEALLRASASVGSRLPRYLFTPPSTPPHYVADKLSPCSGEPPLPW